MPITQAQIDEIRRRALAKGISEQEINLAMPQLVKEFDAKMQSNTIDTTGVTIQPRKKIDPNAVSNLQTNQEEGGNIVTRFVKDVVNTATDYGSFVAESGMQLGRQLVDPITGADEINKQIESLSVKNRELINQAKKESDEGKKAELLSQSRKITDQIASLGNQANSIGNKQKTFLVDEEKIKNRGEIVKTGVKTTAKAASYVVPGGSTVKTGIALGATAGALYGFGDGEDIDVNRIISGAVGGAVGGAVVPLASKVISKTGSVVSSGYKQLTKKFTAKASDEVAERITKATPSQWQKAVDQHGIDLNKLTEKYFPKGGTYDDFLGPISRRGRGGIFKESIEEAEKTISKEMNLVNKNTKFTIDEIISALEKEKKALTKLPGNEGNIKALNEFIRGFEKQYGNGITPKRLLELKRIADSRFGRAVADENTGSAIAQAQKMVANAARSKLKKLLPNIKDALDTEMELYTIQPVLGRARSILNTQGSTIRSGSLKGGITDLINPFNLADAYLSDPKRASKFLQKASTEVVDTTQTSNLFSNAFFNKYGSKAGMLLGSGAGQPEEKLDNTTNDTQNNEYNEQPGGELNYQGNAPLSDNNADIIPQEQFSRHPIPKFREFKSKDEMIAKAFADGLGTKSVAELSALWDQFAPTSSGGVVSPEIQQAATSLRSEYISQTKANNYMDAVTNYRKVQNTPDSAAGDLSLIFAYMKLLDPTSVVRESEQELAQNATNLPGRLANYAERVASGKSLNAKQRQEFRQAAEAVFQNYQVQQQQIDQLYSGFARQYGVEPSLIGIGAVGIGQ